MHFCAHNNRSSLWARLVCLCPFAFIPLTCRRADLQSFCGLRRVNMSASKSLGTFRNIAFVVGEYIPHSVDCGWKTCLLVLARS